MRIFSKTDAGRMRSMNQDAFYTSLLPDGCAFAVVCDGMGGANAGNLASKIAVESISGYVESSYRASMSDKAKSELLKNAVMSANIEIYDFSAKNENLSGMGTTVVTAIADANSAVICHVGDSRAYLAGKELEQITKDHSVVQSLIESGRLTPQEAKVHPRKNVITRALGVEENVMPDSDIFEISEGDTIMLCTDGLTNFTDCSEIKNIFDNYDISRVADVLTDKANENGGGDNITVVLISNDQKG